MGKIVDGLWVMMSLTLEERTMLDRAILNDAEAPAGLFRTPSRKLDPVIWKWRPADFLRVCDSIDQEEVTRAVQGESDPEYTAFAHRVRKLKAEVLQFKWTLSPEAQE